jgi:hypothetical protein
MHSLERRLKEARLGVIMTYDCGDLLRRTVCSKDVSDKSSSVSLQRIEH